MFLGEIAALMTAVFWSATAIFFSSSGRRVGADTVNRSRVLFALPFLAIAHYFLEGSFFPQQVEPYRWMWLSISSLLGLVVGDALLFQAFVLIGPRLGTLLLSTVPIYSTVLGWLLFGEVAGRLELTGILLAVAGIAWVVTERQAEQPDRQLAVQTADYRRGILFGLGAALGQVANLITARYGLVGNYPTLSATLIRILVAVVILWSLALLRKQLHTTWKRWQDRRALLLLLGGSIAGPFLGIWLSLFAIQNTSLGVASTLMALPPVLLIPLEYVIYGRRASNRGIAGTMAAILGVILIFWR